MKTLTVSLDTLGKALKTGSEYLDPRAFSEPGWRRQQHAPINENAYAIFQKWAAAVDVPSYRDALSYRGISLTHLFKRQLTEGLVNALTLATWLKPALESLRPSDIVATSKQAAAAVRWTGYDAPVHIAARERLSTYRLVNIARYLYYIPRLAALKGELPTIPPARSQRPRILFVPYYRSHLPSLLPLIERACGEFEPVIAWSDSNTVRRGDVDLSPIWGQNLTVMPVEAAAPWWTIVQSMLRGVRSVEGISPLLRTEGAEHQLTIPKPEWDVLRLVVRSVFLTQLPKVTLYIDLMDSLLKALRPDLVVVADETLPVVGRIAIAMAQRHGIGTLTVQHGLLLDDPMYYGPVMADCMALWGEESRSMLVERGCPDSKLAVVGSIRYGTGHLIEPLKLQEELELPANTRVVLFLSQPGGRDVPPEANLATFQALSQAVAATPACHLLVKPHPAQTDKELREWQQGLSLITAGAVTFRRDLPLHPTMCGADLCVTVFSTTGLEALWLDRPLMTVNLTEKPDHLPFAAHGAAVGAYSAADVPACLARALDVGDQAERAAARQRLSESYIGLQDNGAVERLYTLVKKLARSGTGGQSE